MKKGILGEYMDACEMVKETEQEIERLQKKRMFVQDKVKGSAEDFPYQAKNFHIAGERFSYEDDSQLRIQEKILEERMDAAVHVKCDVEKFMNTMPIRIQRIIRYKFFEDLTWEQVATKMGRKATGDSVRKEMERYLEKK